ncbi:sugar transferase [Solimonas flava]|uniref:sugar transferase n=1 Tax=Solimonas flava TaxID=415849 RepID=UPI0004073756|nr:sugar transferase [Solimonas flava]
MEGGPATGPLQTRELEIDGQFHSEAPSFQRRRVLVAKVEAFPRPASDEQVLQEQRRFYPRSGKRLFDVAFSTCFLVLIAIWLFPLIGIAVRLNSPGPIFFRQKRVGLNGKIFTCFKFRTMTHDPARGFVQAQKQDSRITRVGAFLRRTNLDEVPQFINVLIGDMSVIGPRPHVPELDAVFKDVVPGYALRNMVKPGVSGLAQISGCRGETRSAREMTHRVRFDLFYCRNVSLTMDMKLIGLTILSALRGDEKAY